MDVPPGTLLFAVTSVATSVKPLLLILYLIPVQPPVPVQEGLPVLLTGQGPSTTSAIGVEGLMQVEDSSSGSSAITVAAASDTTIAAKVVQERNAFLIRIATSSPYVFRLFSTLEGMVLAT